MKKIKFLPEKTAATLTFEVSLSTLLVLAFLMLFFYLAEDVFTRETLSFDMSAITWIAGIRTQFLTSLMVVFSTIGEAPFLILQSLILLWYLFKRRRKDGYIFLGILITGAILNIFLKNMFFRPRPAEPLLAPATGYSFPSGHAMNSFIFYASLAYFVYRETLDKTKTAAATIFSVFMILAIGFSRIYLGLHYFSDVIAGYVAGFIWFTSAIVFEKAIILRRLLRDAA